MNDLQIVIQEQDKTFITIQNEKFEIGRLSYLQIIKLTKVIGLMFAKNVERFQKLDTSKETIMQDIFGILEVLDEDEMSSIISIILKKDKEFCKKLSAIEISELLRIVIEYNYTDFSVTVKNWQRTIKGITVKKEEKTK